jgi:RHS repeat-associated protein
MCEVSVTKSKSFGDWHYEHRDNSDRVYGVGSRLEKSGVDTKELRNVFQGGHGKLVTKGTDYTYDAEGNLVGKSNHRIGESWSYEYYGNGMLKRVVLPDKSEVGFKYDPLGRRIEKATAEKFTQFFWDGNNPIHERANKELTTWVFDDGFVPTAKLTSEGNFSIISDHVGTPVEAYDEHGQQVWSAELDIYGRVVRYTGDVDFVPFRYQGQYHDLSSGLYYNRFRYYDPEVGQYTQIDPIGLAGGNPTVYGYVGDSNSELDIFGLSQCPGNNSNQVNSTQNPAQRQLATNSTNGKNAENFVFDRLDNNPNVNVLGNQVYIRTPAGGRYVDILIQTKSTTGSTSRIIAVEVKSGGATRSANQVAKDRIITSGGGTFGRNAPGGLAGLDTSGIIVSETNIPLWKLP